MINQIPCSKIRPDRNQPRRHFDQGRIEELARSIGTEGVINPIEVREDGEGYVIVTGECRWRAAKLAGLSTIPAKVIDPGDENAIFQRQMIENLHHDTMVDWDVANALRKMLCSFQVRTKHNDLGYSQLAGKIGKSEGWIRNTLSILDSGTRMRNILKEGKISKSYAVNIQRAPEEIRKELERKVVEGEIVHKNVIPVIVKTIVENPGKKDEILSLDLSGKRETEAYEIIRGIAENSDDRDNSAREYFRKMDEAVRTLDNLIDESMFSEPIKGGITKSIRDTVGFRMKQLIPRMSAFVKAFENNDR